MTNDRPGGTTNHGTFESTAQTVAGNAADDCAGHGTSHCRLARTLAAIPVIRHRCDTTSYDRTSDCTTNALPCSQTENAANHGAGSDPIVFCLHMHGRGAQA